MIAFYPITDDGPISQLVQKGVDAGFEVFVGGVVVASQAEKLGKYAIEFGVDEQIVELTIRNAEMMLRRIIEEKEKQEIIRMILFSSTEPLVAVNAKQEIMLSNLAFSNIVGARRRSCTEAPLTRCSSSTTSMTPWTAAERRTLRPYMLL